MSHNHLALIWYLQLFLLVYTDSAYSQVHYYITPSLNVHCPGDPCLTLAQFATNSTSYLYNETDVFLSFLQGNHSLDRELSLSHADINLLMTKDKGTAFIKCDSLSGRFNISDAKFATIKDLHFIGCGGNKVSQVEQFIVEDTIFQGVEGSGTALVLNEVTAATIAGGSFMYNTYSTFENQDLLPTRGGALYTTFTNVSIVSSKFIHNSAKIGGALFAQNSTLRIIGSTYNYNRASSGGVMFTSESLVNIDNSTFSENAAEFFGGVMVTYTDSFSITGTCFINNSAGIDSGVMEINGSSFSVIDSIFIDNRARRWYGVIYAEEGSFSIRNSTFSSSSATSGGTMYIVNSSLSITSSTFTNNSAGVDSGVMGIYRSFFNITDSTFSDDRAGKLCGVFM